MLVKKQITKEIKTGNLSPALVDEFSEYTARALEDTKLSSKDVLRFRISVESAMDTWLHNIGEGAECNFEVSKRFGRTTVSISCEGKKCNPWNESQEEFGMLENSSLLQSLGLSVGYAYENGVNRIRFMPGSGFVQQLTPIIIAFSLGIALALLMKAFCPDFAKEINSQVVNPVFSTIMGALRAIASPLIFLAVLSGIYGIGDIAVLGKIGKKLLGRFILMTFAAGSVTLITVLLLVRINPGDYTAETNGISAILELVLQFIPSDIVSPFLNGNMLQIITISVACGLIMLVLGDRVSELCRIANQIFEVVQLLMESIGKMVPVFIFISMFSLILSNDDINIADFILPVAVILGTFTIMALIVYPLILKIKYNIGYGLLMKKMLPTFLIAFTTASSAAAFSSNVEVCEKKLGISDTITKFGIPLGQVIYMPLAATEYIALSLVIARSWNVQISIPWIISVLIISCILSIASPPIPGGALTIFSILFLQLNIPEAALPIALGVDTIADHIVTAGNIICLQEEMIICADKTNLLDRKTLISK